VKAYQGIAGIGAVGYQRLRGFGCRICILDQAIDVDRGARIGGETLGKRVADGRGHHGVPPNRGAVNTRIGNARIKSIKQGANAGNPRNRLYVFRDMDRRNACGSRYLRTQLVAQRDCNHQANYPPNWDRQLPDLPRAILLCHKALDATMTYLCRNLPIENR
jgi:hypothetical protein